MTDTYRNELGPVFDASRPATYRRITAHGHCAPAVSQDRTAVYVSRPGRNATCEVCGGGNRYFRLSVWEIRETEGAR